MKTWHKVLLSVLILLFVPLLFLPKFASSSFGKPFVIKALEQRIDAEIAISNLELSWFGPQKFQNVTWAKDEMAGTIEEFSIDAPFWSFSGAFKLKNASVTYKGGTIGNIQGQIEGNDFVLNGITLEGYIHLKGQIYSKLHFQVQIDVKKFPLIVIDQTLEDLLGPTIDLFGTISLNQNQGTIDLSARSENLETRLEGNLTPDSITLRKPLIAYIHLTETLSQILLKDVNPLFIEGADAEKPITLRIEPENFYFPLPFNLKELKVGQATLDLGRVKCRKGKSMNAILTLLNAENALKSPIMNAWFTPVSFEIHKGLLHAGRMDALLADSIHVCTWGNIDLIRDSLDMILGIPEDTLRRSFGITNMNMNYVLKVEIRGTTQNPEIVKKPAIAKIAALIAKSKVDKKGFLGKLTEVFSGKKDDAPPPNRPFPWER